MTTNITFVHKRELLLAKYNIVRELSLLTKNLLAAQQFEAATAVSNRLDANTEDFSKQLSELELFDKVLPEVVVKQEVVAPQTITHIDTKIEVVEGDTPKTEEASV